MTRYNRTPLRYPGGKQKLTQFILEILEANGLVGGHYVEAYAGGAGIAFELLLANKIGHVHLNDSSSAIYCFWNAVLNHTEDLCRSVSMASLTVEEWLRQREIIRHPLDYSQSELAFSTLYMNRCNVSGVLSGGLIGGLKQEGNYKMNARFSKNALICRIEAIASRADKVTLRNWDAEKFLLEHIPTLPPNETLVYCDPPYFNKCSRLYLDRYARGDHARIADVIQRLLHGNWLVSYDSAPEILDFYQARRKFVYGLQYTANLVYQGSEVFVFSDGLKIPGQSELPYIDVALKQVS